MNRSIILLESVSGNKPSEQFDFLSISLENRTIILVAYLKGNGYVKLFTLQSHYEYFVLNRDDATCQDIEQVIYDSNVLLERFVKAHYFGMTLPKEELMFGFLGNGVSVCDRLRTQHGDYMKIAHIAENRKVTYYNPVSDEGRARIERFAQDDNITMESQGISALCPGGEKNIQNEADQKLLQSISTRLGRIRQYLNLHNEICIVFDGLKPDCKFDVDKLVNAWYRNDCNCIQWVNSMLAEEREQLLNYYREHSPISG